MQPTDRPDVIGILLVYYDHFASTAIRRFTKLVQSVASNSRVIVVFNGATPPPDPAPGVVHVAGDNSLREFSGWDRGLATATELGFLRDAKLAIFANDTFCFHNKFGPITRRCFRSAFRKVLADPGGLSMAGECFELGGQASIRGLQFDTWMSTYLFGVSQPLLLQLGQISPDFDMDLLVRKTASGGVELTSEISPNMVRYLERWMGLDGESGTVWYGVHAGKASSADQRIGKLRSILAEKYLTALCRSRGATVIDVFPSATLKQLRRIDRIIGDL